ncbi:beta-propeller fold lactonase family protein [Jiella sp. 40Bstr34]|uniref:Beta-propeller fold lactonase family protein n=2 Tax=Jiella pacifica TaxID=2696469 RepID=A0A6N9T9J1_9HYPH|nr:beta-propeller fold lactonase family protein [Jiella pacifica]
MKVEATISIPGKPAGIAVSRDGRRAYVSQPDSRQIAIVDTVSRKLIGEVDVGGGPLGIAVHPSGSPVYVADWYSHSLLLVDPEKRAVVGSFETGQSPSGVVVSASGEVVVTADRDSNQISFFAAKTGAVIARVPVGERPFGVSFSPDGARVYAANVGSNSVSVVDARGHFVIRTVPVGSHPYDAVETMDKVFVTDQYGGTVTVFDPASGERIDQLDCCDYPEGIAPGTDGAHVYVANWFANTLVKLDATSLKEVGSVDVPDGPRAFGAFVRAAPAAPEGETGSE